MEKKSTGKKKLSKSPKTLVNKDLLNKVITDDYGFIDHDATNLYRYLVMNQTYFGADISKELEEIESCY